MEQTKAKIETFTKNTLEIYIGGVSESYLVKAGTLRRLGSGVPPSDGWALPSSGCLFWDITGVHRNKTHKTNAYAAVAVQLMTTNNNNNIQSDQHAAQTTWLLR